jgi:hypothetical protein
MVYPQPGKPYHLYCDALDTCVGAVLTQECDKTGLHRPIQFISKTLDSCKRKWPIVEKEGFALVFAINKLRPYLLGAKFTAYTDHKPLRSLFTKDFQSTKIQRWAVLLDKYGVSIEYIKGKNNVKADMLSRLTNAMGKGQDQDKTQAKIDKNILTDMGISVLDIQVN